jgi:hypothetical protein
MTVQVIAWTGQNGISATTSINLVSVVGGSA